MLSVLDADSDIPISLHEVGELASQTINHIPSISQRSSQSSYPRPPQSFSSATASSSDTKASSGATCRQSSGTAPTSRTWRQQRRTYIPQSDAFEIHSPTMTDDEHEVVGGRRGAGEDSDPRSPSSRTQQLILPDGARIGHHLFFIQLRSLGVYASQRISFVISH